MPKLLPDLHGDRLNAWQEPTNEPAIDPQQPIVDPHHHLWDRRSVGSYPEATPTRDRYMGDDLIDDIVRSGHNVVETVFVECLAMYDAGGGALASRGEVEFVQGVAAMAASDLFGKGRRCCGAMIGFADLTLGSAVGDVLDALSEAGRGFRGIRQAHGFHASPDVPVNHHPTRKLEHLLGRDDFREGFAELARRGHLFESWGYHFQLPELAVLARAFPDVTIVLDHIGGPLGIGPFANNRDAMLRDWQRGIEDVASCPNVVAKLGGCGMPIYGFGFEGQSQPAPGSEGLAQAWKPQIEIVLRAFGPERCMFESNFPVDKVSCSYGNLWNAFKRIADELGCSEDEKSALFCGTAAGVYGLSLASN